MIEGYILAGILIVSSAIFIGILIYLYGMIFLKIVGYIVGIIAVTTGIFTAWAIMSILYTISLYGVFLYMILAIVWSGITYVSTYIRKKVEKKYYSICIK